MKTVKTEPVLPCPHPLTTVRGCEGVSCSLSLDLVPQSPAMLCKTVILLICHVFTLFPSFLKENFRSSASIITSKPLKWNSSLSNLLCNWIIFCKESSACRIWCFWLLNPSNLWSLFAAQFFSNLDFCTRERIFIPLNLLKYWIATLSFIIDHQIECISDEDRAHF